MPGPRDGRDAAALETMLGAAIRAVEPDPAAEQRAVAAFRTAHGAGAHRARTRRRDDWRLPAERRSWHPMRMTFGVVFASLTLGGVAVAAIGAVGSSKDDAGADRETRYPSAAAPDQPGGKASSPTSSAGPGSTGGPAAAQDTEAHCRAYEKVKDRGKALDATAWQRLVAAAGGSAKVEGYCSEQLPRAKAAPSTPAGTDGPSGGDPNVDNPTAGHTGTAGNGTAGHTGTSGDDASGDKPGGTDNAAGNGGQASGGQGSGKHR
ncbi:hypothetical protein ACFYRY_29325 [Streptomyces sp. NPDC005263]|uniref:hypothetical protein n=1 Tax=Streptomyces sp. NPDC005263 TaxID=3364711 RepID=UPI00367B184E